MKQTSIRQTVRELTLIAALAAAIFSPAALLAQAPPQGMPSGPDLIGTLKATPGVLGVEAAQTMSGKQVIFAWFENKQAVLARHYSGAHQRLMKTVATDEGVR